MPYLDPTRIPMEIDPLTERFSGVALHGDTPFDVPFISEILEGALFMGGCATGLPLPRQIRFVVSLAPWFEYLLHPEATRYTVKMKDSTDELNVEKVTQIADDVLALLEVGPTLVHCQAGLNRSGLIVATALVRSGDYMPSEAIALLREKRSPAVLCNPTFERFVLGLK